MAKLGPDLLGPVALELARAEEQLPGPNAMPGGSRYELKWDGFRVELVRIGNEVRLWSRRGTNLTSRFPILTAAAVRQLPEGLVLDGELVVYVDGLPAFGALQSRETARRPATCIVFDVLAAGGVDLRSMPWARRRQRLEGLAEDWVY